MAARKARAIELLADGVKTDRAIARELEMDDATLWRWKKLPEFQAELAAHREARYQSILDFGIASKRERVAAQHDRWQRMRRLVDARAEDARRGAVGGDTGLLDEVEVPSKGGPVTNYPFDAALMKELRELEKQAAQEAGQWVDKRDVTSAGKQIGCYTAMLDSLDVVFDDDARTDAPAAAAGHSGPPAAP